MDVTTMTPAEIDGQLAEIWYKIYAHRSERHAVRKQLRDVGQLAWLGQGEIDKRKAALNRRLDELASLLDELDAATTPLETEYVRRGGWTRFFLVEGKGGHIHNGQLCSTCRPTTAYRWLVDLAGKTDADMIAAYQALVCSVCYPDAPVADKPVAEDTRCQGRPAPGQGSRVYKQCELCGHVGKASAWRRHQAK